MGLRLGEQLAFEMEFNRDGQHEIIAEDFLFFFRVLGIASDTDAGIGIFG